MSLKDLRMQNEGAIEKLENKAFIKGYFKAVSDNIEIVDLMLKGEITIERLKEINISMRDNDLTYDEHKGLTEAMEEARTKPMKPFKLIKETKEVEQ